MLLKEEAKKIGIMACIDAIGYDFCIAHEDYSVSSCGISDRTMSCFVGVSDQPDPTKHTSLDQLDTYTLTDGNSWPFYAFCDVDMENGNIVLGEVKKP